MMLRSFLLISLAMVLYSNPLLAQEADTSGKLLSPPILSVDIDGDEIDIIPLEESDNCYGIRGPFCSYAPPKLSGEEMASLVRKIMLKAERPDFHGEYDLSALIVDFIKNENFEFVSPVIVSEKQESSGLQKLFGNECLEKLTYKSYTQPNNAEDDGPFYVFETGYPRADDPAHVILQVYGLISNSYKDADVGYTYIFKDASSCDVKSKTSITGWDHRKRAERELKDGVIFGPTFSGFGYYKGEPFLYFFDGENSGNGYGWVYKFSWYFGDKQISLSSCGDYPHVVNFHPYPANFNPFSVVAAHIEKKTASGTSQNDIDKEQFLSNLNHFLETVDHSKM